MIKYILLYVSHLKRTLTVYRERLRCRCTIVTHVWQITSCTAYALLQPITCGLDCLKMIRVKIMSIWREYCNICVSSAPVSCEVYYEARSQNCEERSLRHVCVRLFVYGTTRLWPDGFSWN